MSDQQETILTVEGLSVNYGAFKAVQNVSFDVKKGEIFGLLGPNGAGKTSTLSAVEGLLKPAAGSIRVAGYDIRRQTMYAKASMGVQLQSTSFPSDLSVSEIIQLYASIYGVPLSKEKIASILDA